ncbi:MAG: hypothetical protein EOM20_02935 [Spartobacteria bacterium]|nr:hypothetical protein [Spartobacteria bacterium]
METPVRQTTESIYTLCFENATTGLTVRASANVYTNGRSHNANYDYNFSTYVLDSDWSEEMYRDTNFTASCTIISNEAQLAQFAWLVNSSNTFAGQTITLVANLNVSAHYWIPVGAPLARFNGAFDGGSHTIHGIVIAAPDADYQGLFGYAHGGSIRDLTLANVDIAGRDYVGGMCGFSCARLNGISSGGSITGRTYVGGLVGRAESNMANCANSSVVQGGAAVGGIVGEMTGSLEGCANSGAVTSGWNGGGLASVMFGGVIQNCTNSGIVSGNYIGGIVGDLSATGMVQHCVNSGTLQGSGAYSVAGGIGVSVKGDVQNCVNSGAISGNSAAGMVAWPEGTIQDCVNSGAISGVLDEAEHYSHAGSIAADVWDGTIQNCANSGPVSGGHTNSLVGGIVGWNEPVYDDGEDYYPGGTIQNCANSGAVSGLGLLGGLVGKNGGTISNSYWKQTGMAPFTLGATGQNDGIVTNAQSFAAAPGTLTAPVAAGHTTTDKLSAALNAWMLEARLADTAALRRWTVGSASVYPTLIDSFWSDEGNYTTNWYTAAETNFTIGTPEELAGLAVLVNTGIDDFGTKQVTLSADIELGNREWTPVGSMTGAFGGDFNGNGKKVSGVYVDTPNGEFVGLFGAVAHGHVFNLAIQDIDISGVYAGGVAGVSFFAQLINNSVSGYIAGDFAGGGIVGVYGAEATGLGFIGNCWSDALVSGDVCAGGLSGCDGWMGENTPVGFFSYWKNTGAAPYNLPGDGGSGVNSFCYCFEEPPGLLDSAGSPALSESLNNFVMNDLYPELSRELYGWTAGSTSSYPVMIPLIQIDGAYIPPQTLDDSFMAGMDLAGVDATVSIFTNAHPGTDTASFEALMEQAEMMGVTFYELSVDNAVLDFEPTLVVTATDPFAWTLDFAVGNGIDETAVAAMNRLAASRSKTSSVFQFDLLSDGETPLPTLAEYHTNGTATVSFTPVAPNDVMVFKMKLSHENE